LYINKKVICQSDQFYGTKESFFEKPGVQNLNADAGEHTKMGGMEMQQATQQPQQSGNKAGVSSGGSPMVHQKRANELQTNTRASTGKTPSEYLTVPIKYPDSKAIQRNVPAQPRGKSPLFHVSDSSSCVNFGILQLGDNVELGATYNSSLQFQNRNFMHEHGGGLMSWLGLSNEPKFA
jgi:hypothetical protein